MEKKETLHIQEISNNSSAERVKSALQEVWGIRAVDINVPKGEVVISYDDQAASLNDFKQAVKDLGFKMEDHV